MTEETRADFAIMTVPNSSLTECSFQSSDEGSVSSEAATDWDEEEMVEEKLISNILVSIFGEQQFSPDSEANGMTNPLLVPVKKEVMERIMREFWIIFDQEWAANIQRRGNSPTNSTGGRTVTTPDQALPNTGANKRKFGADDEWNPDEDDGQGQKRPKKDIPAAMNSPGFKMKLACPYRKHDPRKYCLDGWRTCALASLTTVARVK
jgi:hypothetical protein